MKICYLADSESIHTKRWCQHFLGKGYEVALISFKNNCTTSGVDFHYIDAGDVSVSGGNWKVLFKISKVKAILKKIDPDILHSHYATSYGIVGALSKFHPYIITALGSDLLISPKESILYRKMLYFAFSKAEWITVMADHMADALFDIGNFQSKTDVVPFGIDTRLFNSKNRNLTETEFVITSTRNFENVYNLPHLLKAIGKIKPKIPDLKINLIGDGSKRDEVEKLVQDLELSEQTIFHGKIEQKEMVGILNHSHLFVSVSLSDGNNISLNEAMACGSFPIATDIPANTQWIEDGENGFLVEINNVDQLSELILVAYQNYNELAEKSFPLNQKIICKKADWHKNLKIVEEKYIQLTNGK